MYSLGNLSMTISRNTTNQSHRITIIIQSSDGLLQQQPVLPHCMQPPNPSLTHSSPGGSGWSRQRRNQPPRHRPGDHQRTNEDINSSQSQPPSGQRVIGLSLPQTHTLRFRLCFVSSKKEKEKTRNFCSLVPPHIRHPAHLSPTTC
jgi:hypothetical protein